jgi:hypothetical protein
MFARAVTSRLIFHFARDLLGSTGAGGCAQILKWTGRVALALVLAAVVVGLWKRDEIARLLAVNSLFSQEKIVANFSGMERGEIASLGDPVTRYAPGLDGSAYMTA